jgi:hypothetical protein
MFTGANQAAVTTTVGLATTYTGLMISNPIASLVNLVLNKVGIALTVAPAAISAIGIMTGINTVTPVTHSAVVTPKNKFLGGPAGSGLLDSSGVVPTAWTLDTVLMGGFTAGSLPSTDPSLIDLDGQIVLPPGGYAAIYTLTVVVGLFSFSWEEVAI